MAYPTDKQMQTRTAQRLVAQFRPPAATGSGGWQTAWNAEVRKVALNAGASPNTAEIEFPNLRWSDGLGIAWGSQVRILTSVPMRRNGEPRYPDLQPTVLFQGFAVERKIAFDGGGPRRKAHEYSGIVCYDYRWLINSNISVYGQYARTAADSASGYTFFSGRRCIFNQDGKKNRAATPTTYNGSQYYLFGVDDYWTARQMLTQIFLGTPIGSYLTGIYGLDNADNSSDLAVTPGHVLVDTMGAVEAVMKVIGPLGWTFREEYTLSGPVWVFFKAGRAQAFSRSSGTYTMLHDLHAPAPGEQIPAAVASGRKMLCAGRLTESIKAVINNPWGLGAPERYETTFYLVPGWLDAQLVPDSADSYTNVYLTEEQIQKETNPDQYSFYRHYHPKGSSFLRDVGRKWVLNEAGTYTGGNYNRGNAFAFESVLPADKIAGLYGPFKRRFLPCLTFDSANINSVGILVEISLDGGSTWQALVASIRNLEGECGIYLDDANLSEILDKQARTFDSGALQGKEINYWTSLCRDKLAGQAWPNWQTRVRVTASVQMDQRLRLSAEPTANSGSPFRQTAIYDFSREFTYSQRAASSVLAASGLPAWNTDETDKLRDRLEALRDANEDKSIAGPLVLDRLWLGDGSGDPEFKVGDGISHITGRWYDLGGSVRDDRVYPEIVQIVYDNESQKQTLITRDARFAQIELGQ